MVSIRTQRAGSLGTVFNGQVRSVQNGAVAEKPIQKLDRATAPARIWGLGVQELHDAFWASRGVRCVRLGSCIHPEVADLYLLLQPGQLAIFDLDVVLNRLIWQGATVTSVRIVDDAAAYQESAVTDGAGNVQRIERHYGSSVCTARGSVRLTDRASIAAAWADAQRSRDWHRRLRCMFPAPLIARLQCLGRTCRGEDFDEGVQFLTELVERWPDPERILDGVEVLHGGVRIRRGDPRPSTTVVGPVWIGARSSPLNGAPCIVGPLCLPDQPSNGIDKGGVTIRSSRDVEAAPRGASKRSAQSGCTELRGTRGTLYPRAKRALDIAVSATVLLLLSPIMAIIAAAIILSDGFPVLFRHRRQSLHGRPFDCLKFRTMYRNAEHMVGDLRTKNLCDGPQVLIEDDPRVTRVGGILRRLHLDELPQLWNVLVGDMSLVGPRPSPDGENRICPAWRELRLSVRPGITGLWQINRTRKPGRDFQEWIRYDIEYVRKAGFWLDLRICMRTALMILSGRRGQ